MKIEISKEDLRSILKEFSADPYDAEGPIVELFIDKMFIKFRIPKPPED